MPGKWTKTCAIDLGQDQKNLWKKQKLSNLKVVQGVLTPTKNIKNAVN